MGDPCILLLDNGSIAPEVTLNLRCLAAELEEKVSRTVHPVSLLHSSTIDPRDLAGEPAWIFEHFLKEQRERHSVHSFLAIPLFFGPSAALIEYLPQRIRALQRDWPELEVQIAPSLVNGDEAGESHVGGILADLVRDRIGKSKLDRAAVAMVDHGTPRVGVNRVRETLASRLRDELGDEVVEVRSCSMERREGEDYDFNEPLLERLLGEPGFDGDVVVSMLFLSPGRHAGPGGDVERICRAAEQQHDGLRPLLTSLVSSHPKLVDLLAKRLEDELK